MKWLFGIKIQFLFNLLKKDFKKGSFKNYVQWLGGGGFDAVWHFHAKENLCENFVTEGGGDMNRTN